MRYLHTNIHSLSISSLPSFFPITLRIYSKKLVSRQWWALKCYPRFKIDTRGARSNIFYFTLKILFETAQAGGEVIKEREAVAPRPFSGKTFITILLLQLVYLPALLKTRFFHHQKPHRPSKITIKCTKIKTTPCIT